MRALPESHDEPGLSSPYAPRRERYGRRWYWPWLGFATALGFVALILTLLARNDDRKGLQPLTIREGDPKGVIADIRQAPRAVVFLDALWSVDAVLGRQAFKEAANRLTTSKVAALALFVLDEWPLEESPPERREVQQQWLRSLDLKELPVGGGFGVGAGSVLWLEKGRVVHEEWSAKTLGADGIVSRTGKVWPTGSQ